MHMYVWCVPHTHALEGEGERESQVQIVCTCVYTRMCNAYVCVVRTSSSDLERALELVTLSPLTCTHKIRACRRQYKKLYYLASYSGLVMFFNACEKNRQGLVNLVM